MKTTKITTTEAANLLVALGFATATGWDLKKLQERIDQVPGRVTDEKIEALAGAEVKATANKILAASATDTEVVLIQPARMPLPKKAPKAPKAPKPATKKKEPVAVDSFGTRVSSTAHAINNAIAKKWRTTKEVADLSGLTTARVNHHLRWLTVNVPGRIERDAVQGARLASPATK